MQLFRHRAQDHAENTTTTTALPTTTGIGAAGKGPPTSMPIAEGQEQRGHGELDEPLGKMLARDRPTQDGKRFGGDHAMCTRSMNLRWPSTSPPCLAPFVVVEP
jgi:hypothetical protein